MLTVPIVNDQPLNQEEYDKLAEDQREAIRQKREKVDESVRETFRQLRKFARVAREKIQELERNTVSFALDRLIEDLQEEYETLPAVSEYLAAVRKDILDSIDDFKPQVMRPGLELAEPKALTRYYVNVLVDNSSLQGAPVITELHPTYQN